MLDDGEIPELERRARACRAHIRRERKHAECSPILGIEQAFPAAWRAGVWWWLEQAVERLMRYHQKQTPVLWNIMIASNVDPFFTVEYTNSCSLR